jgi:hypothetical protein
MTPTVESIFAQAQQLSGAEYQLLQNLLAGGAAHDLADPYALTPAQEARLAETIRRLDAGESVPVDGPTSMAEARKKLADLVKQSEARLDSSPSEISAR